MKKKFSITGPECKELRTRLWMNQSEFWPPLGVNQCTGSRYEHGRRVPVSVQKLVRLIHIHQINVDTVKGDAVKVGEYLAETDPAGFNVLRDNAKRFFAQHG